jgi:1,4-dihydroxy-2-naphthoate octaprenyltransferase
VRDIETDRRAGKNTSAVRMGRASAVNMYRLLVAGAFVILPFSIWAGECQWWPLLGLLAIPMAIKPVRVLETHTDGPALNKCLAATGALLGVYSLLVTIGLLLSA